jgi:hypothetical protein
MNSADYIDCKCSIYSNVILSRYWFPRVLRTRHNIKLIALGLNLKNMSHERTVDVILLCSSFSKFRIELAARMFPCAKSFIDWSLRREITPFPEMF